MLPAANRLRTSKEFELVTKTGERATSLSLVLYFKTIEGNFTEPKVGLIVNSSVGGSVVRHRVSRQLRHAIAPHLHQFPAGTLLVFRAHPGAAQSTEMNLAGEVSKLIAKYLSRHTTAAQ